MKWFWNKKEEVKEEVDNKIVERDYLSIIRKVYPDVVILSIGKPEPYNQTICFKLSSEGFTNEQFTVNDIMSDDDIVKDLMVNFTSILQGYIIDEFRINEFKVAIGEDIYNEVRQEAIKGLRNSRIWPYIKTEQEDK